MPPKNVKRNATGASQFPSMASFTLNLHILKGPREGEILSRKPGTQIRIGRVVNGNNFTIKDPAISRKHISIQFDPEISKWTLYDLNTPDGTIINDVKIESSVQIPLSDGDVIKIGEATLISVKLEADGEFENVNLRRGRSKTQNNSKGLKKDKNLEGESEKMNPRRAGLSPRGGRKLSENMVSVEDSKALQKKVKRGRPKKVHSQPMVSLEMKEEKEWSSEKVEEQEIDGAVEDRNEIVESVAEDNVKEKENLDEEENAKQKENHEKYNAEEEIDFEKMTLGEWFDSLEKYLPLAINEAAEARIAELREKARRFVEYIENDI